MAPPNLKRPLSSRNSVSPPPTKRKTLSTSTTTPQAVANFFKPASQKEPDPTTFQILHESLLVAHHANAQTESRQTPFKLAAFDLDGTLIATKSGLQFPRDKDDWKWWHPSVPARLRALRRDGFAVVVVSNQGGVKLPTVGKGVTPGPVKGDLLRLNTFKAKVVAMMKTLDLPMSVYAATGKDLFRKPRTGMWEQILADYGVKDGDVDHAGCLFVGDAAGRAEDKSAKVKKDHSCSDRDFATNVGIPFHTPEEFFLGEEPKPFTRSFDPAMYLDVEVTSQTDATPVVFTKTHDVDLVLFCGSPGAGKSTFYWQRLQPLGYERVNQDILKSRENCMKAATRFVEDEKPVAVDNTNADIETRAAWIALAKKLKVPIRLVHFTAPAKLCQHNDTVRALGGVIMNPEARTMLPNMAFTGFASRYREPQLQEGFEDITKVDFAFTGTEEQKALWKRYWIS